jgi:hypothetical protein
LAETVFTSPYSPDWFFDLVSSVSRKYGLEVPIRASELRAQPVY